MKEIVEQVEEVQQQDPPTKLRTLYDAVSKDYDLGTFDDFSKKMQDPTKRKAFYDGVGSEYELGTFDEFNSKLGGVKKKVASQDLSQSAAPSVSEAQSTSKDKGFFSSLRETMQRGQAEMAKKSHAKEKTWSDPLDLDAQGRPVIGNVPKGGMDIAAFHRNQEEKRGIDNRPGYLWNKLTKGIGRVFSGNSDMMMNVMTTVLPQSVVGGDKDQVMKQWREEVTPVTREFFTEKLGDKTVTKEQQDKYDNEFLTSAIGGLAESAPAILSPKGTKLASLVFQSQDAALESINSTPQGRDLPESTKSIYSYSVGIAQAAAEKYGLDKIFGKQSSTVSKNIAEKVLADLMSDAQQPITREIYEAALDTYMKSAKQQLLSATRKLGQAGAVEFFTGSLQEGTSIFAESVLNKSVGKEIFEPTSWGQGLGRVLKAGAQEAIGGFVLGGVTIPFSQVDNYISEKVADAKSPDDIESLKSELLLEMDRMGQFDENAKSQIIGLVEDYQRVNAKIPDTVPDRKFAADKIIEREDLERQIEAKKAEKDLVDIAFQDEIQTEINILEDQVDDINEQIQSGKPIESESDVVAEETIEPVSEMPVLPEGQAVEKGIPESAEPVGQRWTETATTVLDPLKDVDSTAKALSDIQKTENPTQKQYETFQNIKDSYYPKGSKVLYHGSSVEELERERDGLIWFTDEKKVADDYRKRSVVSNEANLDEYDVDVMESKYSIEAIADEQGIDLSKGKVFTGHAKIDNVIDLTEKTDDGNISNLPKFWNNLHEKGLVEKWEDIDQDYRDELIEEYEGKATWRLMEGENIYDDAKKKGYDGVVISDVGIDGKLHKAYGLFNLKNFNESSAKGISEAYHKAKTDGSNPELVRSVEELLGNTKKENVVLSEREVVPSGNRAKEADIAREILDEASVSETPLTLQEIDNIHKSINEYEDGIIDGNQLAKSMRDNGLAEEYISRAVLEKTETAKEVIPNTAEIIESLDAASQSKKSAREKDLAMEKKAAEFGDLGRKALEINRNFEEIVKTLKQKNKIQVKCP